MVPTRSSLASALARVRIHTAMALIVLGALARTAAPASAQSPCEYALEYGINPSFQTWSSRAIVFADAMQRVRTFSVWTDRPLEEAAVIPMGSGALGEGWPNPATLPAGRRFGAYLFGSMESTVPDGRIAPYVLVWRGSGHVRLEGGFVAGERNRSPNRVEVLVDPTRGSPNGLLSISWTATDPADPVRDVRVWLPGMEQAGRLFWPPFLRKVRATSGGRGPHTWRTLDWTRVNEYGRPPARGGFVFDLAGVVTPRSPSQGTPRGVAPEFQVALCNEIGMNLHFQLPHRTDDLSEAEYVRFLTRQLSVIREGSPSTPGFGRTFAGLDPSLSVTVELSNEIWNSIFPVNGWMNAQAVQKGIPFTAQVASQIQLLFDVADTVFTGPDAPRLRKYVAGFAADPGYVRRVLAGLRPGTHIDALGPAAYLGPRRQDMDAWLVGSSATACPNCPDAGALIATADAAIEVLRPLLGEHRAVARTWNNPDGSHPALELYEGGLNLKSIGRPWAAAARAVQTDPRLFDLLVDHYVPMLVDEEVALLNWYSFMSDQDSTLVDAFGIWNDMNQTIELPVVSPVRDRSVPKAAVVCMGPPLADACPLATATLRTAPGNALSFTATPPVLGRTLRAEVDPTVTGNTSAILVFSLSPASIALASGQTVLASLTGGNFLEVRNGPLASWNVPIPNDWGLAGIPFTAQAFHLGGGPPVNLSNAVDFVFGR